MARIFIALEDGPNESLSITPVIPKGEPETEIDAAHHSHRVAANIIEHLKVIGDEARKAAIQQDQQPQGEPDGLTSSTGA